MVLEPLNCHSLQYVFHTHISGVENHIVVQLVIAGFILVMQGKQVSLINLSKFPVGDSFFKKK